MVSFLFSFSFFTFSLGSKADRVKQGVMHITYLQLPLVSCVLHLELVFSSTCRICMRARYHRA